ncbi:hypothetical protein LTR66_006626 [Elasticomyces elasticus]|nr:hypothetical protein LTR66_006626 [Elasticomyces elasticus]
MEASPLTLAYSHARKAAEETQKLRFSVAGHEHTSAAENYAHAAKASSDGEALRTLKLLEEHHEKLAQIIRQQLSAPVALPPTEVKKDTTNPEEVDSKSPSDHEEAATQPESLPQTLTQVLPVVHPGPRDRSPALAKDMAALRRGIQPQQQRRGFVPPPSVTVAHAGGNLSTMAARQRSPETQLRRAQVGSRGIGAPRPEPAVKDHPLDSATARPVPAADDDGFAKFYATLTSGSLSKLSSILAYAGLPLTERELTGQSYKLEKTSARASNEPDVNAIYSKAALRAIKDDHGPVFGGAESFYVVPTTGGTLSYANVLQYAEQKSHRHHLSGINEEDEFVDASENPSSSSHLHSRKRSVTKSMAPQKTPEELSIENAVIREMLEKLSRRLEDFESHAQDASLAALTQSMASVAIQAPTSTFPEYDKVESLRKAEQELQKEKMDKDRLAQENAKQKQLLAKYRQHYEQLKESARAKEKARRERADREPDVLSP